MTWEQITSRWVRSFAVLLLVGLLSACSEAPTDPGPDGSPSFMKAIAEEGAPQEDWLKAVRQATARYHSQTQAEAAGYFDEFICVAIPGVGGMGYHWPNVPLRDAIFEPLQPEVLLYATAPNGHQRLVAVEYIVLDVGQGRPAFADQLFDIGGVPPLTAAGVDHWSLHVWLFEENPNGIFARFNPRVSCP
jgi:hypothetical protein